MPRYIGKWGRSRKLTDDPNAAREYIVSQKLTDVPPQNVNKPKSKAQEKAEKAASKAVEKAVEEIGNARIPNTPTTSPRTPDDSRDEEPPARDS